MVVRRHIDDPATARLRAWCMALLIAPFVVILGAEAASRMLTAAPSGAGTFVPAPQVMLLSILGTTLYAAMFTFLLGRLRLRRTDGFILGWRGQSMSRWNVWMMGGLLFALLGMLTPMMLCGAINRAIGQVTFETWAVQGKEHNQVSRGCEFRVSVASRTTGDSTRVCVPRERWERLQADDSLAIMAVFSGLGSEIGAAPDSSQNGGGR
jgi:hypothetical protein